MRPITQTEPIAAGSLIFLLPMAKHTIPAAWRGELNDWVAWMRAANRSRGTVQLRQYHVVRLSVAYPDGPYGLAVEDLARWLAVQSWGAETRRSYRASWATFYKWAVATGRTRENPAALLPQVTAPRGLPRPAPETALEAALQAADRRERLMLLLAAHAGLRRAEIAKVHTRDIEPDLLGASLVVQGKGDVVRRVPLSTPLRVMLAELEPGWAFPSAHGGHLSPAYVGKIVSGLLGPDWTAHSLRHRFASRAYAADRDLRAVQELLGHAKPETTARYTAVPLDAARRAVDAASA